MIANVDSFIKIFKFYQQNKVSQSVLNPDTKKYETVNLSDIFRQNTLRYEDTIDVYLNSLVMSEDTLTYDTDSETIQTALNAREKMRIYFNKVLYPGSYAFNVTDNISFRKLILDWTSTVKTIQDSSKRLTDAYSLSSEDVDKAIRGFGCGFVNRSSILSIEKRKQYLLSICDLYSIKGTPQSIIKALNCIGLNNILIREGWMYKDEVNDDIKIRWEAQKEATTLNESTNSYESEIKASDMYTDWDWFIQKIEEGGIHSDPHWVYTKEEIEELNSDKEIYLKLPSITPYFGVEFISDADKQIDAWLTVYNKLDELFKKHLINDNSVTDSTIWFSTYKNKINLLEAYTALIYSLIRLDDHLLYDNFKSFLTSAEIQKIPDFSGKYQYFQIIYWYWRNFLKNQDEAHASYYKTILNQYIPIKSQDYCNYEQVLDWWLTCDYDNEEEKNIEVEYIQPRKIESEFLNFIELEWDSTYPIGRYSVEVYSQGRSDQSEDGNGWKEIIHGGYTYSTTMRRIVSAEEADDYGENVNCFRIKVYHTKNNLPDIFFNSPFNLDNTLTDTFIDKISRYNGPTTSISFYNDNIIKNAFDHQDIELNTTYDVIQGYHYQETNGRKIRFNEIDQDLRSYYNARFNYPSLTQLQEDRVHNVNCNFYSYVDWSINDYFDTKKHFGCLENNRNTEIDEFGITHDRKWPLNSRWNWAIDSKFVYFCYEANKWCRYRYNELVTITPANLLGKEVTMNYGDRAFVNNKLYIYVSLNKFAVINSVESEWNEVSTYVDDHGLTNYKNNDILPNGKIIKDSKLCRDHAVAKLGDDYILNLIYQDCIMTPESLNKSDVNRMLQSEVFDVYHDPYGNVNIRSYTYKTFLTWLYNARLILDFDTGFIYEKHNAFLIDDKVYLSCQTINERQWVRFVPEFKWNGFDEADTIYSDNKNDSLGLVYPMYTFQSRYDSLRFLDGPIFDGLEMLEEAAKNDQIDESINYVMVRNPTTKIQTTLDYVIVGNYSFINGYPAVFKRKYVIDDTYTKVITKWEVCLDNQISKVNFGINSDLLEFIESRYAQDDQYYVSLPNDMTDSISTYMSVTLGIDDSVLDLTIAGWASSGIVKKLINFYKPKRARLLFMSNVIEGDYGVGNNLDHLDVSDNEYNYYDLATYRWGNPQFNKKDLAKANRFRVREVINDYLPLNDTIFKHNDNVNQVYSSRELRSGDSKIPTLELYDELLSVEQQVCNTVTASFYVNDLGEGMNGFYYKMDDNIYTNNRYYFQQVLCMFHDTRGKVRTEKRWGLFSVTIKEPNHTNCIYVSDIKSTKPNVNAENKENNIVKYGLRNYTTGSKYIDDVIFNDVQFVNSGIVKTNRRFADPVIYFHEFTDERCNGFYYADEKLYPSTEDGYVTYFNNQGKILKHISLEYSKLQDKSDPTRSGLTCNNFWIICDNKQILGISDADYIAFCWDDNSLWDDMYSILTKKFKKNPENEHTETIQGVKVSELVDNEEIIDDKHIIITTIPDNYQVYRRNHFNTVQLKNEPIAYITSNNKLTSNIFSNKIKFETNSTTYSIDKEGNTYGALEIHNNQYITFENTPIIDCDEWTISFGLYSYDTNSLKKIFGNDCDLITDKWYLITLTSDDKLYVNKELKDWSHSGITKSLVEFSNMNIKISEYAIWNYILNEWYIGVINDFRILRSRPEPVKSKTTRSVNSYRPLFAVNEPRTIYPKWSTGLPENITGSRISGYNADPYNDGKVLKQEVNPLWKDSLPEDLDKQLIVKDGSQCYPTRSTINDGDELISPSNYKAGDNVPCWWTRKPEEYKTGAIHHRPVYISLKENIDDPYPNGEHGQNQKNGNYFDIGLKFDGRGNKDFYHNGNDLICTTNEEDLYPVRTFDKESHFTSEYNKYVYDIENDLTLIKLAKNVDLTKYDRVNLDSSSYSIAKDIFWEYTNKSRLFNFKEKDITIDGIGNSYQPEVINDSCMYVPDLDQFQLTEESINNGIFHKTLKFYTSNTKYSYLNGIWTHSTNNEVYKDGDFGECYVKGNDLVAVLTYQRSSGYFWWEIRQNGITTIRTYVKPCHNQNKKMLWYDYVNWNQIDLACQELCIFENSDYTTFATESWGCINQTKIDGRFSCGKWIKLDIEESEYREDMPEGKYFDGVHYYFYNKETDKWYKVLNKVTGEWGETWDTATYIDDDINSDDVDIQTFFATWLDNHKVLPPSGYLYKDGYFYIRIPQDNIWIKIESSITEDKPEYYHQWKFNVEDNNAWINILDSSNSEIEEEEFIYPDCIDYLESYVKLIKFNGIGDYDWTKHMIAGQDDTSMQYVKTVNNYVSPIQWSVKDGVIPFVYEFIENENGDYALASYTINNESHKCFWKITKQLPSGWTIDLTKKYIRNTIEKRNWCKSKGARFTVTFKVRNRIHTQGKVDYGHNSGFPFDPVIKGFTFVGWDKTQEDLTNIKQDIVVNAIITPNGNRIDYK